MVAILEKGKHNVDFHPMVDFIEASPLRVKAQAHHESHHTPSPEAPSPSHTTNTSPSLPPVTTTSIPAVTLTETTPIRDVSQGEACLTDSGFIADQDRTTIAKSSTLPHDSSPWVTSPAAVEGSMQQTIPELTALVKLLEEREGVAAKSFRDDSTIKGRSMDKREAATERISDDTEEMATVLTSMDAATVLASGVVDIPTGSGSIPTASTSVEEQVPTGSDVVPTASSVFATATVVAREIEEQLKREDQRRSEQIARDAEIEYHQFASELPIERRIELNSDLVKYQDHYAKVYKYQSQQKKRRTKKQKRDYYMAVIRNNLGWKVKDFNGMTFEEVEAKFKTAWEQIKEVKKMKTSEEVTEEVKSFEEVSEEKIKEMIQLVPIEEVYVEALQVKHHIIDWKVQTEELSRLYELDNEDQQWTHTQNLMHAPVEWKLYDTYGVHHVTSKDKEIFMLVEKDYPLRKGLALVMISYKLQGRIAGNKMYKAFSLPVIQFPLAEQLPTASEERCHC
nr:hypothetical protein [Tanacetum cinerariifolium]